MALVEEVVLEYKTSLTDLNVNSKPLINMLTMLADDNEQHAPHIVKVIEDHISKCRPEKKLPVLYLIDSIMKNLPKSSYKSLFCKNIVETFTSVFEKVDEKTRAAMYKLRQTWLEVVPSQKLYLIDVRINNFLDPAWPITAPPPEQTSIHVNPKFLSKGSDSGHSSPETVVEDEPDLLAEELEGDGEELDDQERALRQQLIAKQQELLKIKQASIELELAEAEEKMRQRKKQAVKSTPVVSKTTVKPVSSIPVSTELPAAPRDPRLAAGIVPTRDPRLARSAAASVVHTSLSKPLVSSSSGHAPLPAGVPGSSGYQENLHGYGGPVYSASMSQYNGLSTQSAHVFSPQGDVFTGEVYNSPDGARFSEDDSESSISSWQDIRNIPASSAAQKSVINARDPRFKVRAQDDASSHKEMARHHHLDPSRHHHHSDSSKHAAEPNKRHTDVHRQHHQQTNRSHHAGSGHQDHRHSTEHREVRRDSKEHERNSKERDPRHSKDRLSKDRESMSPRQSSSYSATHKSASSQHASKQRGSSKDKDSKSVESTKEKDSDRHKSSSSDKKKTHDSNSGSKSSGSKINSSKSSPKSDSRKTSRSPEGKGPRKSSSSSSQRSEKDNIKDRNGKKSDEVKKKDSKSSLRVSSDAEVEGKSTEKIKKERSPEVRGRDSRKEIKQEVMDTEDTMSQDSSNLSTQVEKGEKRANEKGVTPRAIKKLKTEPGLENDNNNSSSDVTVKMKTDQRNSVSTDISELFGCEDQDYRSVDQKTPLPLKSPSSKGWDTFKAQHSDTFAHDIQLKKQREETEQKRRETEPQDIDYRQPARRQSAASDDSSLSNSLKENHSEILLIAYKQLQEGKLTHEEHQDVLKNLGELLRIQKLQEENQRLNDLMAVEQDLAATTADKPENVDSDIRNQPSEEPKQTQEENSQNRPLERFKIPRLRDREVSPRKTAADSRGELQNLYPEVPVHEQDPRERKLPPRYDRGEPLEVDRRDRDWQPVSPDKAQRVETGLRVPPAPLLETDLHQPPREMGPRGPQPEGFRRGPRRELDPGRPPEDFDGRSPDFNRPIHQGAIEDTEGWDVLPEEIVEGDQEEIGGRGPPNRGDPQRDFSQWSPAEGSDDNVSNEEFGSRRPIGGRIRGRPGPRFEHQRGRFPPGSREPDFLPPEGHERQRERIPPENFPVGHPQWKHDRQLRPHDVPEGPGVSPREYLEDENWERSPREDFAHDAEGGRLQRPRPLLVPRGGRGHPMRHARGLRQGPYGPRGPHPEQFRSQQGSPYAEFPDDPAVEQDHKVSPEAEMINNDNIVYDPHRGLPPWQAVRRRGPPPDDARPPGPWKKRKEVGPEGQNIYPPWEEVKHEPETFDNGPPFEGPSHGQHFDEPHSDGPPRGPFPLIKPRFPGPPRGPPRMMRPQGPRGMPGPHGRLGPPIAGPNDMPVMDSEGQPHLGPPVSQHMDTDEGREAEERTHTEHLPAFLGPANPKPTAEFGGEHHMQVRGKRFGIPRHDRPRLPGPVVPNQPAGPSMPRPLFNGPMVQGQRPRGPVFAERHNAPRGPAPQMESYVDKNGDPRFRSFVDIGPEVSEEVVFGKRNYEIKLGAPPRRIQWGAENIEVYADPSKRGIVVDGVLMYKFGERVKEIVIRGRKEKLFYHGKPLNLWIDGQNYEVRVDSPPKAIFINNKPHRIQIDGRDMMILIDKEEKGKYGGEPRFVFINGERMELRFDPPPRHILIDGKLCELKLNMAQPCVNIEGKLHGIKFDGPPRDVVINGSLYQIFTDHAIKLRVGNRFHYVALGGPCHELIVDGKWFEVTFNKPPKEISVGNTILMVQLPGGLPEVKILPELQPPVNMPAPGPMGPPVPGPVSMPPHSVPGTMAPVPGLPATSVMAVPGLAAPVSAVANSLPSSLSSLFSAAPTNVQAAQTAPLDISSLLDKLKSSGILPSSLSVPAMQAPPAPAAEKEKQSVEKKAPVLPQEYASIRKKNEVKEEKFDDIPDMTEMEISEMKILPEGAIQRMYAGMQCNSCGARFRLDDEEKTEKYREHLDWHFRQNKRDKEDMRVVRCRKWYYGINDWLQYEELGDTEEQAKSNLFEQQQQQATTAAPSQPHVALITVPEGVTVLKCPPATGNDNDDLCDICHEPFEQYWDEEHEQWHLRDAIRVNGKTYHPICYEDYTDVSEGTPSPSVLPSMEPNFSSRKTNYEECSQDGLPHSSFEEERGNVSTESTTEPPNTSNPGSDVAVKLEPMFTSVTEEKEEMQSETVDSDKPVQADSSSVVTTKDEPMEVATDPPSSVAIKSEPVETEVEHSNPENEFLIKVEAGKIYESTGVLPGLDITPESDMNDLLSEIQKENVPEPETDCKKETDLEADVKQENEAVLEEVQDMSSDKSNEEMMEDFNVKMEEVKAEVVVEVTGSGDITVEKKDIEDKSESQINATSEAEGVDSGESNGNAVSEVQVDVSSVKEETSAQADEMDRPAEVSLYTPFSTLNRVKLAVAPASVSEISPEVLEIGSNASTPTRDELPSPPAVD